MSIFPTMMFLKTSTDEGVHIAGDEHVTQCYDAWEPSDSLDLFADFAPRPSARA